MDVRCPTVGSIVSQKFSIYSNNFAEDKEFEYCFHLLTISKDHTQSRSVTQRMTVVIYFLKIFYLLMLHFRPTSRFSWIDIVDIEGQFTVVFVPFQTFGNFLLGLCLCRPSQSDHNLDEPPKTKNHSFIH